jgi:hypothetical protein
MAGQSAAINAKRELGVTKGKSRQRTSGDVLRSAAEVLLYGLHFCNLSTLRP